MGKIGLNWLMHQKYRRIGNDDVNRMLKIGSNKNATDPQMKESKLPICESVAI
jgi:hypothetical protein